MNRVNLVVFKQIAIAGPFIIIYWLSMNLEMILGPPRKRGINCMDMSIRQPYVEDTIDWKLLYVIGLDTPIIVIILNELLHLIMEKGKGVRNLKKFFVHLYLAGMPFLCGFACERFLKNLLKVSVGRLRPHAYTLCQPISLEGFTCEQLSGASVYIAEYTCSGSSHRGSSIYKSFPSGHSSLAFYGLLYLVLYFRRSFEVLKGNQGFFATLYRPLILVIQLLCLSVAAMVAISRVFDYKHFWSDVAAGSVLGATVALAFSYYAEENATEVKRVLEEQSKGNYVECMKEDGKIDGQPEVCALQMEEITEVV
ncbi:phospholipid phosphatase 1-like [Musca vetustissima]|uniref:phospholipid phosphatase 1-like n=1 Tax=Musca vetustissima TaxID=27455 RepID=UPI002AB658C3|nr:phospholipid phosphatase 1-like [Musca vetustissima]